MYNYLSNKLFDVFSPNPLVETPFAMIRVLSINNNYMSNITLVFGNW